MDYTNSIKWQVPNPMNSYKQAYLNADPERSAIEAWKTLDPQRDNTGAGPVLVEVQ